MALLTKACTATLYLYAFLDGISSNIFCRQCPNQSVNEGIEPESKTVLDLQDESNVVLNAYVVQMFPSSIHQATGQTELK